jgi:hypothetical protein
MPQPPARTFRPVIPARAVVSRDDLTVLRRRAADNGGAFFTIEHCRNLFRYFS